MNARSESSDSDGPNCKNHCSFHDKLLSTAKLFSAIALFIVALVLAADVFLLIFLGSLLSIFLVSLSRWVSEFSRLSYSWSLAVLCLLILCFVGLGGWFIAPSIAEQFDELTKEIPQSMKKIKSQIQDYSWVESLLKDADPEKIIGSSPNVLSSATGAISGFLGGLVSIVIVFFIGLYGATEPKLYRNGLISLFPRARRKRMSEVLDEVVDTLKWWLIGKFMSMAFIGVMTAVGLLLMDVPLALALAFIAAVLTFIPNIGPLLSAVPAILLGFNEGPQQALYITILYITIQAIESYLVTPLIQRKTVSLPPALTLSAQVFLGLIFGIIGLTVAAPLTAVALVGTKRIYIEDTLGDSAPKENKE